MNKLMLVTASAALMVASAAQAGPLVSLPKSALSASRLPAVGAMPAAGALPGVGGLPALQWKPGSQIIATAKSLVSDLPGLPELPSTGAPLGRPLQQYWFVYNRDQYAKDLQLWAKESSGFAYHYVVLGSVQIAQDPCYGEGSCSVTDDPVGYVDRVPGVLSSIGNRALGLINGGIGNPPLPKRPGDQPPASPQR